jgi:hypothetical protein
MRAILQRSGRAQQGPLAPLVSVCTAIPSERTEPPVFQTTKAEAASLMRAFRIEKLADADTIFSASQQEAAAIGI